MSCGCGNSGCSGCGCGNGCSNPSCTGGCVQVANVVLSPIATGARPCSPLSSTCGTYTSATGKPYYQCAPQCQEDHCQQIITELFATVICVQFAFNMPACGQSVTVYFPGVTRLLVGGYIWAPDVGYLEITAFDHNTGQAILINHCNDGNAAVGTSVPACTCFDVTPPPAPDNDPTLFPFVAVDFTAPADGDCLLITVTSTNGLVQGGLVQIGEGTYLLDEIVSPTLIRICNEGDGLTPGTVVVAKDDAGNYQYPIIVVATNPCSNPSATPGVVVVCDGGAIKPLTAGTNGQVLTLTDAINNTAEWQDNAGTDCCDTLITSFGGSLPTPCSDYQNRGVVGIGPLSVSSGDIVGPAGTLQVSTSTATFDNTSTCRLMVVNYTVMANVNGTVVPGAASNDMIYMQLEIAFNGGAFSEVYRPNFSAGQPGNTYRSERLESFSGVFTVAAGANYSIQARATVGFDAVPGSDASYSISDLNITIISTGVAI